MVDVYLSKNHLSCSFFTIAKIINKPFLEKYTLDIFMLIDEVLSDGKHLYFYFLLIIDHSYRNFIIDSKDCLNEHQ